MVRDGYLVSASNRVKVPAEVVSELSDASFHGFQYGAFPRLNLAIIFESALGWSVRSRRNGEHFFARHAPGGVGAGGGKRSR